MGLHEELHSAVENPPAPGFDLDQLMHKGHQRRVRSRALIGATGFLAVAMVILGGYSLNAGQRSGGRANTPAAPTSLVTTTHPAPADSTTQTAARLTAALATLPPALHVSADAAFVYGGKQPGSAAADGYYHTSWTFNGVNITIEVFPLTAIPSENACAPGSRGDPSFSCDRTVDAEGTTYLVTNVQHHRPGQSSMVDAFRPDHTYVAVGATTSAKLPQGFNAQLEAAAHAAALTMQG